MLFSLCRTTETATAPPCPTVQPTTITLTVKTITGRNHLIRLPAIARVLDLMKKIEEIDGMPVDQQRLLFNGRQLESENTLAFYGVVDMCTIQTVLRQVGGG
jgi:hypothetical protein